MNFLKRILIVMAAIPSTALLAATFGHCGGDGPTPLIHERVSEKYVPMGVTGSILEYAVSEPTSEIYYRTDTKELYSTSIGSTTSTKITNAPYALSRVIDRKGKYLVTEPDGYFWNLSSSSKWLPMTLSAATTPIDVLFWESDDLYMVRDEDDRYGTPSFQIIKYRAGDTHSNKVCGHIPARGWGYEMASGHGFPYIYFYKTTARSAGTGLAIYRMDVRTCYMSTVVNYPTAIPGNVKWVHFYQGSNTIAVSTDHPTKNLLYDKGNGMCMYYDLGGNEPVIVNPKVPTIAVVRNDNSADLIQLQTGKKNELNAPSTYYSNVRWQDFYLTGDGKNLFVAPESAGNRDLIQIKVKP